MADYPIDGSKSARVYVLHCVPGGAQAHCLAPDAHAVVLQKGEEAALVNLSSKSSYSPWPIPVSFIYDWGCHWSFSGKRCLIDSTKSKADRKTTEDEPRNALLFYDRVTGQQSDLAERLRGTFPDMRVSLGQTHGDIWGGDGTWFVAQTLPEGPNPDYRLMRNWLCRISPWAVTCIQDELGREFVDPKPLPSGNQIAVVKRETHADPVGGVFVAEVVTTDDGKIHLGRPRLVSGTSAHDELLWQQDGSAILAHRDGRVAWHTVPPCD